MLSITILGSNCLYSDKVERHTRTAMRWLAPQNGFQVTRIRDEDAITNYVHQTPALMINDEIVSEGAIPAAQDIVRWASQAMQTALKQTTAIPVESMADAYGK